MRSEIVAKQKSVWPSSHDILFTITWQNRKIMHNCTFCPCIANLCIANIPKPWADKCMPTTNMAANHMATYASFIWVKYHGCLLGKPPRHPDTDQKLRLRATGIISPLLGLSMKTRDWKLGHIEKLQCYRKIWSYHSLILSIFLMVHLNVRN